jgi:LysR family transcriptional regulator, mexEF-oprN operon transcriptional activator
MNKIDPLRIDLNLLKAFDALARERNVTRAAERLRVGQPAMSHALRRLRRLVGDELFVKTPDGMEPTRRAESLAGPIRDALERLAAALSAVETFDPSQEEQQFTLAISDWLAAHLLPDLLSSLQKEAPQVSIRLHSVDTERCGSLLDQGVIDLAVGYPMKMAAWRRERTLFTETHVCVFNPKLVAARAPIALDEYLSHPHILVSHTGGPRGFVDDKLTKLGRSRRVLLSGTQFLLIGYLLHVIPVIATLPRRFAERSGLIVGLQQSPLPIPAADFAVSMMWHVRNDHSASQLWLRQRIEQTLQSPRPDARRL